MHYNKVGCWRMKILYLSNVDSIENNPINSPSSFICELPYALEFSSNHVCALLEIRYSNENTEDLIVETDIIDYSYVNGRFSPVLRITTNSSVFNVPYFFKLKQHRVTRIKVSLHKINGELAELSGITRCVFGIKKKKKEKYKY